DDLPFDQQLEIAKRPHLVPEQPHAAARHQRAVFDFEFARSRMPPAGQVCAVEQLNPFAVFVFLLRSVGHRVSSKDNASKQSNDNTLRSSAHMMMPPDA